MKLKFKCACGVEIVTQGKRRAVEDVHEGYVHMHVLYCEETPNMDNVTLPSLFEVPETTLAEVNG